MSGIGRDYSPARLRHQNRHDGLL